MMLKGVLEHKEVLFRKQFSGRKENLGLKKDTEDGKFGELWALSLMV